MELQVIGASKSKKIELDDKIFACTFNEPLVHQIVVSYLAAGRAGTHAQKNRSAVRGGGAKPWKQKGSGRARAGTSRSPIWRKGGVTFAATTQSYAKKVNKKMYKGAIRSVLSELIRLGRLNIVEDFVLPSHRTKELLTKLDELKLNPIENHILIIAEHIDSNLYLAARNLWKVDVRDVAAVDPVALVDSEHVVMTVAALKQYEELLK